MIAPHLVKRADFDPIKALTPVVATGSVSLYVITNPTSRSTTTQEFLAYARANPGKLNYGTPGNGTSPHIAVEVYNREAKVKLNHVPYKGAGPALKDLLGGRHRPRVRSGRRAAAGQGRQAAPGRHRGTEAARRLPRRADAGGERHQGRRRRPALRLLRARRHAAGGRSTGSTAKCRGSCRSRRWPSASARSRSTSRRADDAGGSSPRTCASEYARYGKLLKELGIEQ